MWVFLVKKKFLYDDFLYYAYKRNLAVSFKKNLNLNTDSFISFIWVFLLINKSDENTKRPEANYMNFILTPENLTPQHSQLQSQMSNSSQVKLIHKDPEAIHGFCLNEVKFKSHLCEYIYGNKNFFSLLYQIRETKTCWRCALIEKYLKSISKL